MPEITARGENEDMTDEAEVEGNDSTNEESVNNGENRAEAQVDDCLLYTSPSPRDQRGSRMPSSA